jgi:hypothetical protein
MRRCCKGFLGSLFLLLFVAGVASLFPVTEPLFKHLPYNLLLPLRIAASISLVFIITGCLLDPSALKRMLKKK